MELLLGFANVRAITLLALYTTLACSFASYLGHSFEKHSLLQLLSLFSGQSRQYLHKWLFNHRKGVKKNKPEASALDIENGRSFNDQNTTILAPQHDFNKRLVLEMLHITKERTLFYHQIFV